MEKSPPQSDIQSLPLCKSYFVRILQKSNSKFRINNIYTQKMATKSHFDIVYEVVKVEGNCVSENW